MIEIELKFQLPPASLEALRTELEAAGCRPQRLQAAYLDTAERHLARARAALRLRREDDQWVQTLKAQGAGLMHRLEHNVPVAGGDAVPALDLARHAGTPAGLALAAALGPDAGPLGLVFETDVRRSLALLPAAGGAMVEAALDEGEIRAAGQRLALCELELELRSGEPAALLALADDWVARHGLWLDTRSKAERGEDLARGPASVAALREARRPDEGAALQQQVSAILGPLLANASVLADSALPSEALQAHLRHWHRGLGDLLHVLGVADLAGGTQRPHPAWAPALIELLAPLDAGAGPSVAVAGRVIRSPRLTRLMLALLGWSQPL